MANVKLTYLSKTWYPIVACQTVAICLDWDEWQSKFVSGVPFLTAQVQNSGRYLGSRGLPRVPGFENPREEEVYQYELVYDDTQLIAVEGVRPVVTCEDIQDILSACLANAFANLAPIVADDLIVLTSPDGTKTGKIQQTNSTWLMGSISNVNTGIIHNNTNVANFTATEFGPAAVDAYALGTAVLPWQQLYWGDGTRVGRLAYSVGNNSLTIGSTTAHQVEFRVNSASVYYMDTSGNFKQDLTSGGNMYLGKAATSLLIGGGANAIPSGISSAFGNPNLTIIGSNSSADSFALVGTGANAVGAHAYLAKTRTTDGQPTTAIQANDQLGRVAFWGAGGTNYRQGAYIESNVVSYTSDNNWDAHLDLAARSVATLTVGLRVRNTGHVQVFKNAAAGAGAALINNCPAATLTAKWMEVYDESGNLGVIPLFLV